MKFLISYPKQTEKNSVFKTFFTDSALERLGKLGEIVYNEGEANFTPDEMKEALKGVDVVFTCWGTPKFDENVLTYADNLKMVCHAAGSAMPVISDDAALEKYRKTHTGKFTLQRYKGLGEMDADQLWETTLNPETRILKQVEIEDARMASEVTEMLMGNDVAPRRQFIHEHAHDAEIDA